MEFNAQDLTPTRKKVEFSLTAAEVSQAIQKCLVAYQKDLNLPGFRKGKVPLNAIMRRYGDEVKDKATSELVNSTVEKVFVDAGLHPISRLDMDNQEVFKEDTEYKFSISFDVLPVINFPNYEGLEVKEYKEIPSAKDVDDVLIRLAEQGSALIDITEDRQAADGDVVDVDYAGFDEKNEPVDDVKGEHFSLTLGQKQALDDFEALVKTAKVGDEKSGLVKFPEDYGHKPLAGKEVTFKIKLNKIQAKQLPEFNDDFSKLMGFETMVALRDSVTEHLGSSLAQRGRDKAMQELLEIIMKDVEFELPASMKAVRIERIVGDRQYRLERIGKKLEDLGKTPEDLQAEAEAEAVLSLKPQVFLMALAAKENLTVTENELDMALYQMAMRERQEAMDFQKLREAYYRSGLINELRDRLMADKALEMVYSKAKIETITEAPEAPAVESES